MSDQLIGKLRERNRARKAADAQRAREQQAARNRKEREEAEADAATLVDAVEMLLDSLLPVAEADELDLSRFNTDRVEQVTTSLTQLSQGTVLVPRDQQQRQTDQTQELHELRDKISALSEKNRELQLHITQLNDLNGSSEEAAQQELQLSQERIQELEAELQGARTELSSAQRDLRFTRETIYTLENDLSALRADRDGVSREPRKGLIGKATSAVKRGVTNLNQTKTP